MSDSETVEPLVLTGHSINAGLAKLGIHCHYHAAYGAIRKSVWEEIETFIAYRAKLLVLRKQYDLEVHVRLQNDSISLAQAKAVLREARQNYDLIARRIHENSTAAEVAMVAHIHCNLKELYGLVQEGMCTKVPITDPEVIANAGLLGLR